MGSLVQAMVSFYSLCQSHFFSELKHKKTNRAKRKQTKKIPPPPPLPTHTQRKKKEGGCSAVTLLARHLTVKRMSKCCSIKFLWLISFIPTPGANTKRPIVSYKRRSLCKHSRFPKSFIKSTEHGKKGYEISLRDTHGQNSAVTRKRTSSPRKELRHNSVRAVQEDMAIGFLEVAADIAGWGYFLAWTVSFAPQIYENWRRKSVTGFSLDMWAYFMISYVAYLVYNAAVFFDEDITLEVLEGSHDQSSPVKPADVVFAIVAFSCTAFQGLQCAIYDRGRQRIEPSTLFVCFAAMLAGAVLSVVAAFGTVSWLFVLNYCGYVKLCVSFGTVSSDRSFACDFPHAQHTCTFPNTKLNHSKGKSPITRST